jgi:hypothetical protein
MDGSPHLTVGCHLNAYVKGFDQTVRSAVWGVNHVRVLDVQISVLNSCWYWKVVW